MICTVTSTAKSGAYRLTTTYLTDPARDSVVVHTRYMPLTTNAANYPLYLRLDANVGGNGGGGTATAVPTTPSSTPRLDRRCRSPTTRTPQTKPPNRDYAVPSFLALRADQPFCAVSSGFVGTPDRTDSPARLAQP